MSFDSSIAAISLQGDLHISHIKPMSCFQPADWAKGAVIQTFGPWRGISSLLHHENNEESKRRRDWWMAGLPVRPAPVLLFNLAMRHISIQAVSLFHPLKWISSYYSNESATTELIKNAVMKNWNRTVHRKDRKKIIKYKWLRKEKKEL